MEPHGIWDGMTRRAKTLSRLEQASTWLTTKVGTPMSILVHTIFFVGIFALIPLGVDLDSVMLILTTVVSLEAIYLAIFIQMTVNKNTQALEGVEENIEEIQEDVEDIQEDVVELEGDVKEIGEDVEEISKDVDEIGEDVEEISKDVEELGGDIEEISEDIEELQEEEEPIDQIAATHRDGSVAADASLQKIQDQLQVIMRELQELKKNKS